MGNQADILYALEQVIHERQSADPEESYVAKLLHGHEDKLLKKIGEEATETVIAAKGGARDEVVYESADLIFHLMVLLRRQGIALDDICVELARRFGLSGLTEKAQRTE
ncbi:phosphoribosyl-ATP diphosphatase [Cardiobacteriaceae bacterium TAE3-ERU3]|nr:phosphoribosyl-ATP diphosphatase [Cardiobacteriaceae bacterium TAE3-ERU3]